MTGPVKKFQAGTINCSLWENEMTIDGQSRTVLKATIERRYKDKTGEWKSSSSYSRNEIPLLMYVLQQAFGYMLQSRKSEEDKTDVEEIQP